MYGATVPPPSSNTAIHPSMDYSMTASVPVAAFPHAVDYNVVNGPSMDMMMMGSHPHPAAPNPSIPLQPATAFNQYNQYTAAPHQATSSYNPAHPTAAAVPAHSSSYTPHAAAAPQTSTYSPAYTPHPAAAPAYITMSQPHPNYEGMSVPMMSSSQYIPNIQPQSHQVRREMPPKEFMEKPSIYIFQFVYIYMLLTTLRPQQRELNVYTIFPTIFSWWC